MMEREREMYRVGLLLKYVVESWFEGYEEMYKYVMRVMKYYELV